MNELTTILICMVSAGTPIIYALLGDLIGQRTGITSLSVEGSMLCGACVGFAVAAGSGSLFLAVLCAAIAGGLIGLIQAFLSISRKSNMMATGFILIFFAQGLTTFFGRSQLGVSLGKSFSLAIPVLSKIPVIGPAFFQQDILTYIAYVLPVLAWWFLTKTRTGLVLCSVGERPDVTRAYGYNPVVLQYGAVIFAGVQTDIADLLQLMDVFVFPSITEGFGISIIEAQAAGVPCVISDTIPESVDMGYGIVNRESLGNIEDWIIDILKDNHTKLDKKIIRQKIKKKGFDLENLVTDIQELYI